MEAQRELREVWRQLRRAWEYAKITDAEFVERAEQIDMDRLAWDMVAKDLAMP
jgi:hypothetical protein